MSFVRSLSVGLAAAAMMVVAGSAHADGDAAKGEKLFNRCKACHSLKAGQQRVGPSLHDVYDRKAGSVDGFKRYSKGLKNADFVWDAEHLDKWLANPRHMIKGAKMMFQLRKEDERQDIIAYLKKISNK